MKLASTKNKTLIGINNARLCTKFFLTAEDHTYLKAQNLDGLSSTDQYTGTLPDGTTLTCDKRAFFTKKAMMELQHQKTGVYSLPNKAGIFSIEQSSENIIIRNLSLIGPGSVDIDGVDLITNQGKHVWVDHCTLVDSQDGALDSKVCDWATYTFNHFYYTDRSYSHAYTCGCGWVNNHEMVLHLTFACNIWGAGCMRRLPQADDCYIHLVNNYHNCPGNSVGMTINGYSRALVEGNFAATGVKSPLTGSGSNRNVTARDNSFANSQAGSVVTVPYQYNKMAAADVPATLTGEEGAGATLGNDASNILSTIPTVARSGGSESVYVFVKEDAHIGIDISAIDGETTIGLAENTLHDLNFQGLRFNNLVNVGGTTNNAPIIIQTTKAGTLTIFFGGAIGTSKTVYMLEGENGLTGKVLSTGAEVANASKPAAEIAQWDALVYTLEANKTYKFSVDATKWRLAALRYVPGATGISAVRNTQSADGAIYDLQGIRVSNPTKGIYIQNGRKTVMK